MMKILGIETSCDETAAAVVEIDDNLQCTLLSNVVASSIDLQIPYGGVVPEIAARSHIESIIPVIDQALQAVCSQRSGDPWEDVDGIAVTYGAGLSGSLLIGVLTARTLAIAKNKPLYAINHVESHVYANFITSLSPSLQDYIVPRSQPEFPILALIVSGGHSQLAIFRNHFDYALLGQTQDDAIGEAFDKVAKLLGLPYPGGPSISKKALDGNPDKYLLPKARMPGKYDFSFSGPKTAVLRLVQQLCSKSYDFPSFKLAELLTEAQKADVAASFQHSAIQTVVDKTEQAYKEFKPASVVIAGGVAANTELRNQLSERLPLPIQFPDMKLCTDNGAMIAALGGFKAKLKQSAIDPYKLDIAPNLSM